MVRPWRNGERPEASAPVRTCSANGYFLRAERFVTVAEFIIATHSPVLLAIPGTRIYELDEAGISTVDYDDLQAVRQMRGFLDAPERYLGQMTRERETDGD